MGETKAELRARREQEKDRYDAWCREQAAKASGSFRTVRASDGHLSLVLDSGIDDCICPPGLVGTDLACRIHGLT